MRKLLQIFLIMLLVDISFLLFYPKNTKKIIVIEHKQEKIQKQKKSLKIGSFNIQVFGKSKMAKKEVVEILVKILEKYDIVLIQEIRDKSGKSIKKLLKKLNENNQNTFKLIISKRLGNSSSKEQYAYIYNHKKVNIKNFYIYPDKNNVYEREPYAVHFQSNNFDFIIVGIHIDPDVVIKELSHLDIATKDISNKFNDDDIIIMGDLNADCSYISIKKLIKLNIYNNYNWLISNNIDTTVSKTDCAYDRIITSKNISTNASNAKVNRFDLDFNLTMKQAKKISDHYPVEFELIFWILSFLRILLIKKRKERPFLYFLKKLCS